ncbi:MAG: LuxR C-terminal-related transcriptional regulator [Ilumatobacteraceae bacterium]
MIVRSSLVGRDRQCQVIVERLGREGSRSAAIELVADAGMGKTSLLDLAADHAARRGQHVLRLGVTEAEQALPWAGMMSLQPSLPEGALDDLVGVQRHAMAVALGEATPALVSTGPYVATALRNVFRSLASSAPVVLTVDDLQWLDPATAAALAVAIRGSADLPVTVVAASRVGEAVPIELDRIVVHDHVRLVLEALSADEVHQLLRQTAAGRLTGPLVAEVAGLSRGNPLYTVLLGEHLAALGRAELPRSIVGSYLRRLETLPPDAIEVLEHAALLGRPDVDVLTAACPSIDVPAALLAAERAGLITGPADAMRFVHPLLPTALGERLGTLGRDRIHRRLATSADGPERRAVHLAAATTAPDEHVAAALEAAAQGALARGARIEAGQRFERAGALTPPAGLAARWGRALAAADAYLGGGDLERAARQAAIAVELAAGPVELAMAGGVMVQVIAGRDGLHPAHDYVTDLLRLLEGQSFLRSFLNRARVRIEQAFDLEAALEHAEAGRAELCAAGDPRGADVASVVAENCRFVLGLPTDPLAAWALAMSDADPTDYLSPGWMAVEMLVWDHQLEAAQAAIDHFADVAEDLGNMLVECKLHDMRANLAARRGDLVTAEWEVRRAMDTAELTGYPASMAASGLARILAVTGRHEEAEAVLATIEVPGEDLPLLHVARSNGLGVAALAEGRWEDGVEHLQHAWNAAEKLGMGDLRALPFRNDLVEGLVRVGRIADAAEAADRIDDLAARSGAPAALLHAGRARMQVLVAQGCHDDALELGRRMQALAEDHVVPMDLCRVLQVLGTAQRRSGRRREALATLTRARGMAVEMGAVVWRDRIDEELARLGGRRDPYALTRTEEQVAELVATGRSNKEVANELMVSLRTVESNLTRVYRKLGVRSRAELAAGWRTSRRVDPP